MEDIANSTFTAEKINVSVSREVLEEIMCRAVHQADEDVEESVDDILQCFRSDREERENKYGDAGKGYQWENVYLPNGTQLYIVYNNTAHHAAVKFETIVYKGESYSPSVLVRKIANGTARNAWTDLFIQMPGDDVWRRAEDILMESCF